MKELNSLALRVSANTLLVLDQRELPHREIWLNCRHPQEMVALIQTLAVRGAPLIGIAAALSLAHFVATAAPSPQEMLQSAHQLINARPTAVNLSYCINRQLAAYQNTKDMRTIIHMAEQLFAEDQQHSTAIANYGAAIIQSGKSILTHCNTGGLVTTGMGTALGAIIQAHNQGKNIHVYVNETRPLLQGARLTTWELLRAGIPHTLCCDNMAASLMRAQKIQRVITGADRIAANGDTANKIGTYGLAALARLHAIPFHIAAPQTTIDWNCKNGNSIVIEERDPAEVRGFADSQWAPASSVYNPAFDVTPAEFITSFITDGGVFNNIKRAKIHHIHSIKDLLLHSQGETNEA